MLGGLDLICEPLRGARLHLKEEIQNMKNILVLALNKQVPMVWTTYGEGQPLRTEVQAYSHKELLPAKNLNKLGRGSPASDEIPALFDMDLSLGRPWAKDLAPDSWTLQDNKFVLT